MCMHARASANCEAGTIRSRRVLWLDTHCTLSGMETKKCSLQLPITDSLLIETQREGDHPESMVCM